METECFFCRIRIKICACDVRARDRSDTLECCQRLPLELDNENTCVHQLFTRTRDRLDQICTNAKWPWIIVRYEQRDVPLCGIESMNLHAHSPAHGISANLPERRIVESKLSFR